LCWVDRKDGRKDGENKKLWLKPLDFAEAAFAKAAFFSTKNNREVIKK
jgi:hypothetical protein